jgi:hypothetical protein
VVAAPLSRAARSPVLTHSLRFLASSRRTSVTLTPKYACYLGNHWGKSGSLATAPTVASDPSPWEWRRDLRKGLSWAFGQLRGHLGVASSEH